MSQRCGITTGTCAAAAARAAAIVLRDGTAPTDVEVRLPAGQAVRVPVIEARRTTEAAATASVRKDAGDDDDVTDGLEVRVTLTREPGDSVRIIAGEGVGTVTKPGLQVPPGQPAINPAPRQMILSAVRDLIAGGLCIEIAIPGGREAASRTFNPRLGIEGGLSILGTTGIVRPHCTKALRDALRCTLDVAAACGATAIVLVPGNIGAKAARRHFSLAQEQVIEVSNEWGFVLDQLSSYPFHSALIVGHPGKLAKLSQGHWDTHSSRSEPAVGEMQRLCSEVLCHPAPSSPTVEGLFSALSPHERAGLANELAKRIQWSVAGRVAKQLTLAVVLVDMSGNALGSCGDTASWK